MSDRYQKMFARLKEKGEGAFIPFCVLGDPDPKSSFELIKDMMRAGADALELGLPFSDPIADGPVIQRAGQRALAQGVTPKVCFDIIKKVRGLNPDIPIGLLVYANLVEARGATHFYQSAKNAGVDSVLIADVPSLEISPYRAAAKKEGLQTVMILPMDAPPEKVRDIACLSEGYVYLLSRSGVTGTETKAGYPTPEFIERLQSLGSAPPVLGFGISNPGDVKKAMESGCRGAISGSAVVAQIEELQQRPNQKRSLGDFIAAMKVATKGTPIQT